MLRDGGSLIVSFQSRDSCEYWVMFPVEKYDPITPTFKSPVLVNRTTGIEMDISHGNAKQWIKTLKPYFDDRHELQYFSKADEVEIMDKMLSMCDDFV